MAMNIDELPTPLREPLAHGMCLYHIERAIDVWLDESTRPLAGRITVAQATVTDRCIPHCWLEIDGQVIDLTPSVGQQIAGEIVHQYHHDAAWFYAFMQVENLELYSVIEAIQLVKAAEGQFQFWKPLTLQRDLRLTPPARRR